MRTGLAALFSIVFTLIPATNEWMAVPFFSVAMAILITDVSLGRCLRNAWIVLCGSVVAMSVATFFRHIFGASVPAMISCLAVVSFIFTYPDFQALGKKIALAVSAILYIQFAGQPDLSLLLPLRLGGNALLGAACAVVAMILPWPQLAVIEVGTCSENLSRAMTALFSTLLEVFCAEDKRTVSSARIHARTVANMARSCLADLKERELDLTWELGTLGPLSALQGLIKTMDILIRHAEGMELALEAGVIVESPRILLVLLKRPLEEMGEKAQVALAAVTEDLRAPYDAEKAKKLVDEGRRFLLRFNGDIHRAREVAYYHVPLNEDNESNVSKFTIGEEDDFLENPTSNTASLMASYFFLFNARYFMTELLRLLEDITQNSAKKRRGLRWRISEIFKRMSGPHDPVSNLSRPHVPELPQSGLISPPSTSPRAASCLSRDHSQHEAPFSNYNSGTNRESTRLQNSLWKILLEGPAMMKPLELKLTISARRIRGAVKVAIAMTAAALAGRAVHVDTSFWAPVTVSFVVVAGYQGGSFKVALLRLQGSVLGAIFGYLVLLVGHNSKVGLTTALVAWVTCNAFIRYSSPFGYAGLVAAFTAPIIVLGYGSAEDGYEDFALSRITQTCVGILCFIAVEMVLWPERAVKLVHKELHQCLTSCRFCTAAIVASYMDDECARCRKQAIKDVADLESSISRSLALQEVLAKEAVAEPELWHPPFPAEVYNRLIKSQCHILRLLYFMDCSLQATFTENSEDQMAQLVVPLKEPLQALEKEILASLDSLLDALRPNSLTLPANFNHTEENPTQSEDIEHASPVRPQSGNGANNSLSSSQGTITDSSDGRRPIRASAHPLLRLSSRRNLSAGPSSSNLPQDFGDRSALDSFVHRYEELLSTLIRDKIKHPDSDIVKNVVALSFNSLVFSMKTLMEEALQLEAAVVELIQVENPLDDKDIKSFKSHHERHFE